MKRSLKWILTILLTSSVALLTGCSSSGTSTHVSIYSGYGYPHYGYYGGYYYGGSYPPPTHRPPGTRPPGTRPPGTRPPRPTHPIARPDRPNRPSIGRPSTRPSSSMRSRPSRGGGGGRRR